jgi:hypothetical protein
MHCGVEALLDLDRELTSDLADGIHRLLCGGTERHAARLTSRIFVAENEIARSASAQANAKPLDSVVIELALGFAFRQAEFVDCFACEFHFYPSGFLPVGARLLHIVGAF